MDLDELKSAWLELDRRLERSELLQSILRRELSIDKLRSSLRWGLWLPGSELAISLFTAWLAGGFLVSNYAQILAAPVGALSALVLLALAVTSAIASAWQIVLVETLDFSASVLQIQRRLTEARALRIRLTQLGLLLWLPLWPAFIAFIVQDWVGFDIYRQFDIAWFVTNIVFGIALALILVWLARRYGTTITRLRLLQRLSDNIAGRQLMAATAQLHELARFERE